MQANFVITMSEFWKRTLSGAVYVGAVVGSILYSNYLFCALFLVISCWAVHEYHVLMKSHRGLRICAVLATLFLWMVMCCPLVLHKDYHFLIHGTAGAAYGIVILAALIDELWRKADNPIANWGNLLISQIMIALPFCTMSWLMQLDKYLLLALFVLMWVNDSGAYCVGTLTAKKPGGNHKMFPRVSPKKSWEGLFGGMACAIGAAYILHRFGWFDKITAKLCGEIVIILFAILATGFGTLGDLMESLMKRTVGVKDSGCFLPGHGGVLDRFDSLLLATPVVAFYSWVCYALSLMH